MLEGPSQRSYNVCGGGRVMRDKSWQRTPGGCAGRPKMLVWVWVKASRLNGRSYRSQKLDGAGACSECEAVELKEPVGDRQRR